MTVSQLQRVDRWLGIPLCFALTQLRRLGFERQVSDRKIRNLLFVKLAEQGSTVLAYPAIRAAIERVGKENVYFLVFDDNRFILDSMDVIPPRNIITISFGSMGEMLRTGFRALGTLRRLRFDAVVDLEFFSRGSAALSFITRAQRRVGFHPFFSAGPYRGDLMTHRLLYNPHLHTGQTFLAMVNALEQNPHSLPTFELVPEPEQELPPQIAPNGNEIERVRAMLKGLPEHSGLILLNPNASDLLPLRRWPIQRYVQLAQRLLVTYREAAVAFTGSPPEAETAARLARDVASARCISLAGETTLRQLLVLFTLADVLVTNDSGPAHFATLTPIQVVTLFGPETPALFSAPSKRNRALWAGISCSPCVSAFNNRQSVCRNNVCMQALSVEQVFEEVCKAFESRRKPIRAEAVLPETFVTRE